MTILIAPDKFKGSLSAHEVCDIVSEELRLHGSFKIVALPLADGGEGTCELLTTFSGGTMVRIPVRDPLARTINSEYGISKDGRIAFLEMATASGLQLLKKDERNPLFTTTLGTGDLIRHALDSGVDQIIMGVGGSATNDGGMGMAESLGVVFYNASGNRLAGNGQNLAHIQSFDSSGVHPRLAQVNFTIFCDVDNPLHGPNGAAYVFSPQKGADEQMVRELDNGLKHYQNILEKNNLVNAISEIRAIRPIRVNFPGAGAGGGLPASLKAFASIKIRRGMDFIAEFTNLEEKIKSADFVITGEGKVDSQTLSGKVVKGVADLAKKNHKRLAIIAGKNELDPKPLAELGATAVVTLVADGLGEQEAMQHVSQVLKKRVREQIIPLLL
ncbi:MAG TPA: glycerate kinase [Chryseolinea sp.]|nr:glycerate kinase [Chryseolinea sp.]